MIRDYNISPFANIDPSKIAGGGMGLTPVAQTYFIDRNVGRSGDGMALHKAFKTWGEAIGQVNADYTAGANKAKSRGRMRRIMVAEGWYSEVPLILTASDVHILGIAPGNHDSIVLYGSGTAGEYDGSAGGPALSIRGSNNTIEKVGMFTYDAAYPVLRLGGNASDADGLGVSHTYGNKVLNVDFVRDVADGADGGILDYGLDGTLIQGCFFSTSMEVYGVKHATNGVYNPVNPQVIGCRFIGVPRGIFMAQGHNGLFAYNFFQDDTSDRADTCDEPIYIDGTGLAFGNVAPTVTRANLVQGGGTYVDLWNHGSDTVNT